MQSNRSKKHDIKPAQNARKPWARWTRFSGQIANYSQLTAMIFSLLLTLYFTPAKAQAQSPIVVEIFTSKYCPACPRGDKNFNTLIAENPNIIGLSCHVSYFDKGTRKDRLSKPFCDARQNIYRQTLKTGGIFTPMMIFNGREFTTGIKTKELQKLKNKAKNDKNHPVGIFKNGQYLDIALPSISLSKDASVWLMEIEKRPTKRGYTHYRNNIQNVTKLLDWDGKKLNMAFPVNASSANISHVILVHDTKGRIIAAGKT